MGAGRGGAAPFAVLKGIAGGPPNGELINATDWNTSGLISAPQEATGAPASWPTTAATVGSNAVHVQAVADPHAGRAVVVAALDNLGKGAAGQAIQAANLMLGLPETAGLTALGVAPWA